MNEETNDQQSEEPQQKRGLRNMGGKKNGGGGNNKGGKGGKQLPRVTVRPMATPARPQKRHRGILLWFVIIVLGPVAAAAFYLYTIAQDQYASTVGFTVRAEETASATDLLGGIGSVLGGGGSNDAEILYEYVRSQEIVKLVDEAVDLRAKWSVEHSSDPLMTFDPDGTIEDLTDFWARMVRVHFDAGSGLMQLRVKAFNADDAKVIAEEVFAQSSAMINELSQQAREDATSYAREDLTRAEDAVRNARENLTTFRLSNQIVDPSADIQSQMGLLTNLQNQLAEALIEFDLVSLNTQTNDPRLTQAQRRIDVIQERIDAEREKFGAQGQGPGGSSYADTIADFERLTADREFAERTYVAARTAYDAALAEAQRQSRYLAAYVRPTLAEKAEYPQRELIVGIVALFAFLIWAISSLVFYAVRDRR